MAPLARRWHVFIFPDKLIRIIKGIYKCNNNLKKKKALLIILDILQSITLLATIILLPLIPLLLNWIDQINFDTIAKVAFARFLQLGEFTYLVANLKNKA